MYLEQRRFLEPFTGGTSIEDHVRRGEQGSVVYIQAFQYNFEARNGHDQS